ncbi:hypothetical protein ACFWAY_17770 [Rhodococcus sp. NPDC059968]|uniref:hypothetical protein n=1 Tax=Rhodococcus sp. NPDC059968 TaxID=3347017 RepID=UPI00366AD976
MKEIHFAEGMPVPPLTHYAGPKILAELRALIVKAKAAESPNAALHAKVDVDSVLVEASRYRSVHVESYTSDSTSVLFELANPLVTLLHEVKEAGILPNNSDRVLQQPRTLRVEVPWSRIKAITERVDVPAAGSEGGSSLSGLAVATLSGQ